MSPNFFLFCFIFIHFLFRESTFRPHERSLCERSPWRLKAPSTRNRVKPSEKPSETEFCGFKSSGEPRPSDKGGGGGGGGGGKKKKFFPPPRAPEKRRGGGGGGGGGGGEQYKKKNFFRPFGPQKK